MEREASNIRSSSSSGAGEPFSSAASYRCCICKKAFKTEKALCGHMRTHPKSWRGVKPPTAEQQGRDVKESAAAEESIPVRKLVPINQRAEDGEVIMKDGFNQPANISVVAAGAEAGVAAGAIIAARNGTVPDVKKGTSSKKKGSSGSSAAGGSGPHTCEKCGRTFATGQSLGGHMRKHYEGPLIIINKKRAREQREETPAPAAERKVVRMVSYFNGPFLESHNPALLSQSEQASDAGDYGRGNEACRLHNFFPNVLAEPEAEPESAPQPEPETKGDDGDDDELLSLRLGRTWSGV
ncbi:zinc finger and SCAN domain-containing protein 20-like [Ananas comosus]|uniref:Zinc finger and SCAN domain-containing protein 20-like n=1 Tax=Ananas comosus TaxID=4615 RepID=A0A6P5GVR3_ANACO|nr:zinc finger and SCAN domain-containing protein 20-like [Ananas comosus]